MAIRNDLGIDGQVPMAVDAVYDGIIPPTPASPDTDNTVRVAQTEASIPPATVTIELEGGNIARLPADADISNVRSNGTDLEFVQPDGTIIVVPGGAIANLVLFVGDAEIPAETVALMFTGAGIEPAAGPEGSDGAHGSYIDLGTQTVGPRGDGNDLLRNDDFDLPDAPDFNIQSASFTTSSGPTIDPDLLIVGSEFDDNNEQQSEGEKPLHVVPGPAGTSGEIVGLSGNDVLVGDVGGSEEGTAGQVANFVLVLDTSGSIGRDQMELMREAIEKLLEKLGDSKAEDVRVHIVTFGDNAEVVGTFDLISNGALNQSELDRALDAVDDLDNNNGATNYEAGLQQALKWIQGGTETIDGAARFDAEDDHSHHHDSDDAYVLTSGNTKIAIVSGWEPTSTSLADVEGSNSGGWGVGSSLNETDEMLRFDFGAFNDFDGNGDYERSGAANGFSGPDISSATFKFRDFEGHSNTVHKVNYTVFYVDAVTGDVSSETLTATFSGDDSGSVTINAPAGKLIDYIEFTVPQGEAGGRVDLESVVVAPGTLPDADVNELIFISDGEPNRVVDDEHGDVDPADEDEAISQLQNELAAIASGNANALDQSFHYQAFSLSDHGSDLDVMDEVDEDDAVYLEDECTLADSYAGIIDQIGAIPRLYDPAGDDVISGNGGDDLIFGDVLNTDALNTAQGLGLPAGSGWAVFAALEAGSTGWTRADTIAYIRDPANHAELAAESGRTGGNDIIDAGAGNDTVFGQEGNDQITGGIGDDTIDAGSGDDIIQYNVGDGDDAVDGGIEAASDKLEISNATGLATTFDIGAITGGVEIGSAASTDIQVAYSNANGTATVRMDEIEDIVINLGSAGDTVNITTPFVGTQLDVNTITINGGEGIDQVDLTGRNGLGGHRVVANGAGGTDTVVLDFNYADITAVEIIADGFRITHNGVTDEFTNFETFEFLDGTQTYADLTTPPDAASAPDLSTASDTGSSGTDNITKGAASVFTGSGAEAGAVITLYDTNGTTVLGTGLADGSGNWSITSTTLSEGEHTLTVTQTDVMGLESVPSATLVVTVDRSAPNAPSITVIDDVGLYTGALVDPASSDDTQLLVKVSLVGTNAKAGDSVQLWNGTTALGTTVVLTDADILAGVLDVSTPTLANGSSYNLRASITDVAGNAGSKSGDHDHDVTIDTQAPTGGAPTITSVNDNTLLHTGQISDGGLTNDNTLQLSGTRSSNTTVAVFDGDTYLGNATSQGPNGWTFTTLELTEGDHAFTVRYIDAAGNTGSTASSAYDVEVDTIAPTNTVVISQVFDNAGTVTGALTSGDRTNDTSLALSGTYTGTLGAGEVLGVYDGATRIGTAVAANGSWTYTDSSLSNGDSVSYTVKVEDEAGNRGPESNTFITTIDTSAAAPGTPNLADASDTGWSSTDNVTNVQKPTLTGSGAEAGATVTLYEGVTVLGTAIADSSGNWSITTTTDLGTGQHTLFTKQVDVAGNASSASSSIDVTIDITAPSGKPAITAVTDNTEAHTGSIGNNGVTNDSTLTISGTGNSASGANRVAIYDGTTLLGIAVISGSSWSFPITSPLGDGQHSFTARYIDQAGNLSTEVTTAHTVTIDTVAPTLTAAITKVVDNAGLITGDLTSGGVTDDKELVLSGTISAGLGQGEIVVIYDGATRLGAATVTGTTWSYTDGSLSNGNNVSYTARVEDAAGNSGPASAAFTTTIDASAPTASGETIRVNDATVQIPEWLLLLNDSGSPLNVSQAAAANGDTATLDPGGDGTGKVTFVDNSPNGGTFSYKVADAVGNESTSATATINRSTTGTISGGSGSSADTLFGYTGNDQLNGGNGSDTYAFRASGDGNDTISDTGGNADTIVIGTNGTALTALNFEKAGDDLDIDYNNASMLVDEHFDGQAVEQVQFLGGATFKGYELSDAPYALSTQTQDPFDGTSGNDIIAGTSNGETLDGSSGNDLLFGNGGNDVLIGGGGEDLLVGGSGSDRFVLSELNVADVIADFESGDTVDLSDLFTKQSNKALSNYVNYNETTGELFVDASGNGNFGSQAEAVINNTAGNHPTTITIIYDDFQGDHTTTLS